MAETPRRRRAETIPQGYDANAYPPFAVTVDIVVLTLVERALQALLIRRGEEPCAGRWALPGGFKRPDETLDAAARRELREETGVDSEVLRQFGAYGDPGRDPRMNVVSVGYFAVVGDVGPLTAGTDADEARLWPVKALLAGRPALAFDHRRIIADAVARAGQEMEATSLATAFVGPEFTLSQLREAYEAVWGVELDPANFRRSMLRDGGLVRPTGKRAPAGESGGRPAEVYAATEEWSKPPSAASPRIRPPRGKGAAG